VQLVELPEKEKVEPELIERGQVRPHVPMMAKEMDLDPMPPDVEEKKRRDSIDHVDQNRTGTGDVQPHVQAASFLEQKAPGEDDDKKPTHEAVFDEGWRKVTFRWTLAPLEAPEAATGKYEVQEKGFEYVAGEWSKIGSELLLRYKQDTLRLTYDASRGFVGGSQTYLGANHPPSELEKLFQNFQEPSRYQKQIIGEQSAKVVNTERQHLYEDLPFEMKLQAQAQAQAQVCQDIKVREDCKDGCEWKGVKCVAIRKDYMKAYRKKTAEHQAETKKKWLSKRLRESKDKCF